MSSSKVKSASDLKFHRFIGVSLGGGKSSKTSIAALDYFQNHQKVFLYEVVEKIGEKKKLSPDKDFLQTIDRLLTKNSSLAFDVPLTLPKCITCTLKCPGYSDCKVKEVQWMRETHKKRSKTKSPNKEFTPYTERSAEVFLSNELEEPFHPSHALGANSAPLTARAQYLQKHLKLSAIEVAPKVSVWRIGRDLKVAKSQLRFHKHSVDGEDSRLIFMNALMETQKIFIYQQDLKLLIENLSAFEAFITALTNYLKFKGECEKRPTGFPRTSTWIEIPKVKINW